MLRICGVTFTETTNYGSEFQAYALRTAIMKMQFGEEECEYDLLPDRRGTIQGPFLSRIKVRLRKIIHYFTRGKFRRFEKNWLSYASAKGLRNLAKLNTEYDAFVCGSDVIWNPDFNWKRGYYYLDFADKYAFSYAVSLGRTRFSDEEKEFLKRKIERLNAVSVREKEAALFIRDDIGVEAVMMPDPVILLERDEWNEIVKPPQKTDKYVFIYTTSTRNEVNDLMLKIAHLTGYPVIVCRWAKTVKLCIENHIFSFRAPEDWLSLICNAEYVITNSFHATVFAVIFHKKFFSIAPGKREEGYNIRLYNFLDDMGLGDRIVSDQFDKLDTSVPDYALADKVLIQLRKRGLTYIRKNITMAIEEKHTRESKLATSKASFLSDLDA